MSTLDDQLSRILNDRRSGSLTLTTRLIKLFKRHLRDRHSFRHRGDVRALLDTVVATFPAMALMYNLRQRSNRVLQRQSGDWRIDLYRVLEDFGAGLTASINVAARHFAAAASTYRVLLTLSSSGAVMRALRESNAQHSLSVIVCESRPAREGVAMARTLSRHGVQTELVTDAAGGGLVEAVDAIVLGADWLHPAGFVNKTGSRMLSDLACLYRKDVYVIGSKLRFNRRRPSISTVRVSSPFNSESLSDFEWIAWSQSHRVVTESGIELPVPMI